MSKKNDKIFTDSSVQTDKLDCLPPLELIIPQKRLLTESASTDLQDQPKPKPFYDKDYSNEKSETDSKGIEALLDKIILENPDVHDRAYDYLNYFIVADREKSEKSAVIVNELRKIVKSTNNLRTGFFNAIDKYKNLEDEGSYHIIGFFWSIYLKTYYSGQLDEEFEEIFRDSLKYASNSLKNPLVLNRIFDL